MPDQPVSGYDRKSFLARDVLFPSNGNYDKINHNRRPATPRIS